MRDGNYIVVKAIPLVGGQTIPINTEVVRVHGNCYINGVLLTPDYQKDFSSLIENEIRKGWKYLRPNNQIIGKSIIGK